MTKKLRKGGLCHIDVLYCIISFFLSFTPGLLNTLLHPMNRLPHTAWPWPLYPHSIDSSSQYWFRHYPNLKTQAQNRNMCIYSVSFFYLLLVSGSIEKILFLCLYIFFLLFFFPSLLSALPVWRRKSGLWSISACKSTCALVWSHCRGYVVMRRALR